MLKKYISIFSSIFLLLISFYYTSRIVNISKNNDPIMLDIKAYSNSFSDTKEEALIIDKFIIPGKNGYEVNINDSYSRMKKIGKFDKNLLVFQETTPTVSIKNYYDNYIISGNKNNNNVSIIIELKNTSYIEDLLKILNIKNIKATFFIDKEIFDNSIDAVKLILSFGHDVELLSSSYSAYDINRYNSIIKLVSDDKLTFCFFDREDDSVLKKCKKAKLYSIIPTINIDNYLYDSIKNNLSNGSIIKITNNLSILRELSTTINYIHQRGEKIVLLKNLIKE